jgi:hypothetical protein
MSDVAPLRLKRQTHHFIMAATKQRKPSNQDGEYTINNNNEASNQDWILSAYRTLEPRVRAFHIFYELPLFTNIYLFLMHIT